MMSVKKTKVNGITMISVRLKQLVLILVLIGVSSACVFAQQSSSHSSGKQSTGTFIGGTLILGLSGGNAGTNFSIGGNPEIGYTLDSWVDAGFCINAIFNTSRFYANDGYTRIGQNAFNYGAGIFLRVHPFDGFFLQLQPEHNWINYTQRYVDLGGPSYKETVTATSVLAGIGYGTRDIGNVNFFTTIMIDLMSEVNSPYRIGPSRDIYPIIRGGVNFYLRHKK